MWLPNYLSKWLGNCSYGNREGVCCGEGCVCSVDQQQRPRAGEEPGALGKARRKLLEHLAESKHYQPAKHISSFPINGLWPCPPLPAVHGC